MLNVRQDTTDPWVRVFYVGESPRYALWQREGCKPGCECPVSVYTLFEIKPESAVSSSDIDGKKFRITDAMPGYVLEFGHKTWPGTRREQAINDVIAMLNNEDEMEAAFKNKDNAPIAKTDEEFEAAMRAHGATVVSMTKN